MSCHITRTGTFGCTALPLCLSILENFQHGGWKWSMISLLQQFFLLTTNENATHINFPQKRFKK